MLSLGLLSVWGTKGETLLDLLTVWGTKVETPLDLLTVWGTKGEAPLGILCFRLRYEEVIFFLLM